MKRTSLAALLVAATALPAAASSDAAWEEFRTRMETECRALAKGEMTDVSIRVDSFGSESYGMALITGNVGEAPVQRICVMDKQSQEVELGGELAVGEASEGSLSFLAAEDLHALETMAETAETTLSEIEGSGEPLDEDAMEAARTALAELNDAAAPDLAPGSYACTVFWYGFLDQGARRVGDHRCEVSVTESGLTVEKVTGEGMAVTLLPAGDRLAYVGRTFLQDQEERTYDADNPVNAGNSNFGNKVGLAAADGEALYLLSTQARGMQPPDSTFFEVIAVYPGD